MQTSEQNRSLVSTGMGMGDATGLIDHIPAIRPIRQIWEDKGNRSAGIYYCWKVFRAWEASNLTERKLSEPEKRQTSQKIKLSEPEKPQTLQKSTFQIRISTSIGLPIFSGNPGNLGNSGSSGNTRNRRNSTNLANRGNQRNLGNLEPNLTQVSFLSWEAPNLTKIKASKHGKQQTSQKYGFQNLISPKPYKNKLSEPERRQTFQKWKFQLRISILLSFFGLPWFWRNLGNSSNSGNPRNSRIQIQTLQK